MNAETDDKPAKKRGRKRISHYTVLDAGSGAPAAYNRTVGAFIKVAAGEGDVFWRNMTRSGCEERSDSTRRRIRKLIDKTYETARIIPYSKRICSGCIMCPHKAGEAIAA